MRLHMVKDNYVSFYGHKVLCEPIISRKLIKIGFLEIAIRKNTRCYESIDRTTREKILIVSKQLDGETVRTIQITLSSCNKKLITRYNEACMIIGQPERQIKISNA